MITIVDYKTGNLGSIQNILKRIGEDTIVTSESRVIAGASKIILPGVGAFDTGMQNLSSLGLIEILTEKALVEKIPVLGICLGMQLLGESSEEGTLPGLGWIRGRNRRFVFNDTAEFRIPHMGWNFVSQRRQGILFADMYPDARFYFVHSYYLETDCEEDVLTSTNYEMEFTSSVEKGNIMGVQFHPEKSHKFGMKLLKNFVDNC